MKHKVGDKVKIRTDLLEDEKCFMEDGIKCDWVVDDMTSFNGKEVTISHTIDGVYKIKEDPDDYNWTDTMFE